MGATAKPAIGTRFALFLYSTANMVGSLLALMVIGCYLMGIINEGWFYLTVGAYVFGYLISPKPSQTLQLSANPTPADILPVLDQLISHHGHKLPREGLDALQSIRRQLDELMPKLSQIAGGQGGITLIELTHAITRDLPATLANYTALPGTFAQMHPIRDGKTARVLLLEQLTVLNKAVETLSADLLSSDAERLANHGQYLEGKFGRTDFV
jgi:hypothetical protein